MDMKKLNERYISEPATAIGLKPRDIHHASALADERDRCEAKEAKRVAARAKSQAKADAIKA